MTISIRALFAVLFPVIFLSACGSGAQTSTAGGPGTNTGGTGLILFGSVSPTFTSSDTGVCFTEITDPITGLPTFELDPNSTSTDSVTLTITLTDPILGFTTKPNQGITFDTYRLVYTPINQGIPIPLTPRTRALTTPVPLASSPASVIIVLVDLETKNEYRLRDSGSVNTYNVRITYTGRDFLTNQPATLVVDTQMEIGAFCGEAEEA
jgi:hypothetical protein